VGHTLPHADPVHKITIIPRGRSLGSTWSLPEEDRFLETRQGMLDDIASLMGGRVSEEIAIGDITTGASNDIERATKLAKQMVTRFGMSEKLGPQTFGEASHEVFLGRDFSANADYSPEIAYEIDKEVSRLIDEGYAKARLILTERREHLDLMAQVLVERETVDREELAALLDNRWEQFLIDEAARKAAEPDVPEDEPEDEPPAEESASDAPPEAPPMAPPIFNA
jgi:cell division protease FtsH